MRAIEILSQLVGIQPSYVDTWNNPVETTDDVRIALLTAMGLAVENDAQTEMTLLNLRESKWQSLVDPVAIIAEESVAANVTLRCSRSELATELHWSVKLEDGKKRSGRLNLCQCEETDTYNLHGQDMVAVATCLPKLPWGYHQLTVELGNKKGTTTLIVAPKACYNPEKDKGTKTWGLAAQLYAIKSEKSWGMGDFSDLNTLVESSAKQGASVIGLNPLHPLYPGNPAHCSPYSPTTRRFLNTIYLDVSQVVNYEQCKEAKALVTSDEFKQNVADFNNADRINYEGVSWLKHRALNLLFDHFYDAHIKAKSELAKEFDKFCRAKGKELDKLALFDALYEHFREINSNCYGWQSWPAAYQDPESKEVTNFKKKNSKRVRFFKFLQWNADLQLGAVAKTAADAGMATGLYLDLAVGCDGNGAEVWGNRSLFVSGASIGAPPDLLNSLGQDWGLTPMNPIELENQQFEPFIEVVRDNMRHAGALRIDHVFGLMRQYWIAPGYKPNEGAFILFPIDKLLRIVALESHRAHCLVIGEDLGTEPEGFCEVAADAGMLSYKVLYFERWKSGLFQRPEEYPSQSMVTVSTHDLPTLPGWWTGRDIQWRQQLELYPNEEMKQWEANGRFEDRQILLDALYDAQVLDQHIDTEQRPIPTKLIEATQRFLARTSGQMQMIPLEDALGIEEQVNIPGTIDEHPNWKQRITQPVDEYFNSEVMQTIVNVMHQERPTS